MLALNKVADVFATALHVLGGLYGSLKHIGENDPIGAINGALVIALCMLIIGGAVFISEVLRAKARRYARKRKLDAKTPELPRRKDRDA